MFDKLTYQIIKGNSRAGLKSLPMVNCVVTSPPYFRKRKYGNAHNELGREKDVHTFISDLIYVFSNINLHPKGSIWVNLGDTRGSDNSLLMIPEQFSLAMISHGWKLADSVIWAKMVTNVDGTTEGGCMIEPAPGRLNGNSYEQIYRFVKTKSALEAWTDTCAVRIPRVTVSDTKRYLPSSLMESETSVDGRNLSNVWRVNMGQTREKHHAVYPTSLCERPIVMTCPMFVCDTCGFCRERIVEMVEYDEKREISKSEVVDLFEDGSQTPRKTNRVFGKYTSLDDYDPETSKEVSGRCDSGKAYVPKKPETKGWTDCGHNNYRPGIVLDPFSGSGTTGEVALKCGRSYIGIDLYDNFVDMTNRRCERTLSIMREIGMNPFESYS